MSKHDIRRVHGWETTDGNVHFDYDVAKAHQYDLDYGAEYADHPLVAFDRDHPWGLVRNWLQANRDFVLRYLSRENDLPNC